MSKWKSRTIKVLAVLSFLGGVLVLASIFEPTVDPELHEKLVSATPGEIEELIAGETEKLEVTALSVTIVDGDDAPQTHYFGRASEGGLMQAASLSKAVAAAVILLVAEQQGVGLDDDIRAQITSLDVASLESGNRPVTLRQLLSHTAGASQASYAGYARDSEVPSTTKVLRNPPRLFEFQLEFDGTPGEFRYSGGGYTLAQLWAEDVSGKRFAQVAEEQLFDPLGMTNSSFEQVIERRDVEPLSLIGADAGFDPTEGIFSSLRDSWHVYPEQAAAGLWTTSHDYARFAAALLDAASGKENAVPAAIASAMIGPQTETGYEPGSYYGLGLLLSMSKSGDLLDVSHSGANAGYRAYFIARPSAPDTPRRAIVVIANTPSAAYLNKAIGAALLER
ncbi:serine hydrolase domain-containing protein [Altererythrobacter sp. ZODW24]|uniref:serine hydrolase domain-containing protein n=1 Tax=Altererythrobacter sp. ZODW24 TaxID=2185142 RepID=UPI000DF77D7C|nr:serine hydrolase domain-containing protein [Altererythrobacter sp. ZODW24]